MTAAKQQDADNIKATAAVHKGGIEEESEFLPGWQNKPHGCGVSSERSIPALGTPPMFMTANIQSPLGTPPMFMNNPTAHLFDNLRI